MPEFLINIRSDSGKAVGDLRQTATQLNALHTQAERAERTMSRWNQRQQQLARQNRTASRQQLTDEQQLARLQERRLILEQRLARATQQGNAYRVAALKTRLAENRAALQQQPGGLGFGGMLQGWLGGAAARAGIATGAGAAGLAAGGPWGIIAGVVAMLAGSAGLNKITQELKELVSHSKEFAHQLEQMSESFQSTDTEMLRVTQAAATSGVPTARVLRALSSLQMARAQAAGGDATMLKLFRAYGVTPEMLSGETSPVIIGETIAKSLGTAGATAADLPALRRLLGGRPEAALRAFRASSKARPKDDVAMQAALDVSAEAKARDEALEIGTERVRAKLAAAIIQMLPQKTSPGVARLIQKKGGLIGTLLGMPGGLLTMVGGYAYGRYKAAAYAESGLTQPIPAGQESLRTAGAPPSLKAIPAEKEAVAHVTADALTRIGLFPGGAPGSALHFQHQQLTRLDHIRYRLDLIHGGLNLIHADLK